MHRPPRVPALHGCAVLVPVKSFALAKARLAPQLDAGRRAELARAMATHVVRAAAPLPVAVVCDDDDVAAWATDEGAIVLHEPGRGLNGAVETGVGLLGEAGATEVLVAHSDLPLARRLGRLAGFAGVTLVPDRASDGTNIACVPVHAGFHFAYGPRSFSRHVAETQRLGLDLRVLRDPELTLDIDRPADLAQAPGPWT